MRPQAFAVGMVLAGALLGGCIEDRANSYVKRNVTDLELFHGKPVKVDDLPDGRRAYHYYMGGSGGDGVANIPACRVIFVTEKKNQQWMVVETRWPEGKEC